ncbi:MAG: hypothetical protein WC848_05270 [Parcubacteria group bacterium]|jgi:hypothetical protein
MTTTVQSVTDLFNTDDAADLGIKDDTSKIMIANLNATTLPMCVGVPIQTIETEDVIIMFFCIDRSPSMKDVRDVLIETFNEVMIDGLRGASKKTTKTIIIGGLSFSSDITPLWGGGFKRLEDLPYLTHADYDPEAGSATNQYQAQVYAITAACAQATDVFSQTGTPPKVIIVGLGDGADNVGRAKASSVKTLVDGLSRELFQFPFAVFETWEKVDGRKIAKDTGFDVFEFKKVAGETTEDIQRRFRHMIGTLSSQVISGSLKTVGTPTTGGFWDQS